MYYDHNDYHTIIITILSIFVASSSVASKYDELDALYASIAKVVSEGLSSCEKASNLSLSQLQCTIMVLKAACNNDPCYIDRWDSTYH